MQSPLRRQSPFRFLLLLLLCAAPLTGWAQGRAQAVLQLEGVPARYKAMYAPGAVSRDARAQLEAPDQAIAGPALKALDAATPKAFNVDASVAAVRQAVTTAGAGAAAPSAQVTQAIAKLTRLRADYLAMNDAARTAFFQKQHATPPDAPRVALVDKMAATDLREVDFSSQLLLSAVVKQLARGNAAQFTSLSDQTLQMAVDTLWSRGVTSPRPRNLLIVAREFERQVTLALLIGLSDADVAALLDWRSDAQAGAERDALVGAYREQVKAGGARAIRSTIRSWPRGG